MSDQDPKKLTLIEPTNRMLNSTSSEVTKNEIRSDFIQNVIIRMLELAAGKGNNDNDSRQMVGLAAVQLGVLKRIVAIDLTADGSHRTQNLHILVNPVVTLKSNETEDGREGCWSCGNICGNVDRSQVVKVEAVDPSGKKVNYELTGFVARIAQHEIDHLEGIRFPDRIPADEPQRLHLVLPSEFPEYRIHWASWKTLCPRKQWEEMKAFDIVAT